MSPTQKQLTDCLQIVLTYLHDWDHHSVRFPKGSHSNNEEYLFAGIAETRVDALRIKVHDTEIEPGLRFTIHNLSFIATRLVSQVKIADAKFPDATRSTDIEENIFEGRHQDVPSHRIFTPKEIH